jgi:hypothetical protein
MTTFKNCVSILGMLPCDSFASTAVVSQEWSVGAPNSPCSESCVSPEVTIETLQPATGKLLKTISLVIAYGISNQCSKQLIADIDKQSFYLS